MKLADSSKVRSTEKSKKSNRFRLHWQADRHMGIRTLINANRCGWGNTPAYRFYASYLPVLWNRTSQLSETSTMGYYSTWTSCHILSGNITTKLQLMFSPLRILRICFHLPHNSHWSFAHRFYSISFSKTVYQISFFIHAESWPAPLGSFSPYPVTDKHICLLRQ